MKLYPPTHIPRVLDSPYKLLYHFDIDHQNHFYFKVLEGYNKNFKALKTEVYYRYLVNLLK